MKNIIKKLILVLGFFIFFIILCTAQQKGTYRVKVNVHYELAKPGDTLVLRFEPHILLKTQEIAIADKHGKCTFDLAQPYPFGIISIEKYKTNPSWKNDSRMILYKLYWEKGDDITINIKDSKKNNDYESKTTFKGIGSDKYRIQYSLRAALKNLNRAYPIIQTYINPFKDSIYHNRLVLDSLFFLLDQNKQNLSPFLQQVLKADILFSSYLPYSEQLQNFYLRNVRDLDNSAREKLIQQIYKTYKFEGLGLADHAIAHSYNFQKMAGSLFYSIACIKSEKPMVKQLIAETNAHLGGLSKQSALLASIVYIGLDTDSGSDILLRSEINSAPFNLLLNQYLNKSRKKVYNYTFLDTSGKEVDLIVFKGKYLLLDFWFSGCGACAVYYQQTLKATEEEFKGNSRIAIISISSDKQLEKWKKSIPTGRYTNPDAINLNTGSIGNNHTFYRDFGIFKNPLIILVDPNGNIMEFDTENIRTNKEQLIATIKKYIQ